MNIIVRMESIVFGVTGKIGAGKDTLAECLAKKLGGKKLDVSDIVRRIAKENGIPWRRKEITAFSARALQTYGPDFFLSRAVAELYNTHAGVGILSGIRTPENVAFLRSTAGVFSLIAVVAEDAVRFDRILLRGGEKDPSSVEELIKSDEVQDDLFRLSETIGMADHVFDNSGSVSALEQWVDDNFVLRQD